MTQNRDALDGLKDTVHGIESAVDSAVVLISGLVNRLASALMGNDLAADITSLRDELEQAKTQLAASVAANTLAADDSDSIDSDGGELTGENEGVAVGEPTSSPDSGEDTDASLPSGSTEGDEFVEPTEESDTTQAGTGVIGDGVAVDTSATTDDVIVGNGDGSVESASGAGVNDSETTDSSDENGNAAA